MNSLLPPMLQWATGLAALFVLAAMALTFLRFRRGPSLPDRVIAIDLFAMLVMGSIILYAFYTGFTLYLDAALVLAFLAFLGTVAFARYLEKRVQP
jgi:multicomponent Na+:H+ antiporter subunit F